MVHSNTVLRLSQFALRAAHNKIYLTTDSHPSIAFDLDILELLQVFSRPRTLGDAAAHPSLAHDWVRRTHSILALIEAGVLVTEEGFSAPSGGCLDARGFGGASEHIAMLDDGPRTHSYLDAIRAAVGPGDTVIDLGCGTGVLAATAARCGAFVHALERTAIADAAEALFKANDLQRRIELHRRDSSKVQLDHPADVLITELVGNEPLSERILEYILDARHRLLKPRCRMLPRSIDIAVQCLRLPEGARDEYLFSTANTARWSRDYRLDFTELKTLRTVRPLAINLSATVLAGCTPVGDSATIASIDFASFTSPNIDRAVQIPFDQDCRVDAVCMSFLLRLDSERSFGNGYFSQGSAASWSCRAWLPHEPLSLTNGDTLAIRYWHTPIGSYLDFPEATD